MTELSPSAKKVGSTYRASNRQLALMQGHELLEFENAIRLRMAAEIRKEADNQGLTLVGDIWHARTLEEPDSYGEYHTVYRAKAIADVKTPERNVRSGWD